MKHMAFAELQRQVKEDEGFREHMYKCTAGKTTIGYGLNLEAGITEKEAAEILKIRLNDLIDAMERYSWYNLLGDSRKTVIINMVYQLGESRFFKFKKFIAALTEKDFKRAADEMIDSNWHKQTPNRVERLVKIMRQGTLYQ